MALALILVLGLVAARAQEGPKKAGKSIEYWAASASKNRIALAGRPETPFVFRKEPALRWSNPLRKTDDGALFLWTDRGRPEVAACVYHLPQSQEGAIVHELQSLSVAPLVMSHDGRAVWTPTPGVTPAPIPDAPRPAAGAAERLRQIRALAREFKVHFDGAADRSEIRPLTQPFYRFETETARPDVLDGALFGYVHATDPEALLLIEARADKPGAPMTWHFAFGRMSAYPMRAEHKGKEVWKAERIVNYGNSSSPYWGLGAFAPED